VSGTDRIRKELKRRRGDLAAELSRLTEPPAEGASVGFGKRVGDGTTEAVERLATTATARSIASSLRDIDRAIAKLDDGSYGSCDACGTEIAAPRLAALPATSLCIECASAQSVSN